MRFPVRAESSPSTLPESVTTQKQGPVWTIVLHRPARRNAVDRATAEALSAAFSAFDRDEEALAAVLYGAGGHFCAGADLQALADGDANRLQADGDGPMGPTRLVLNKPVVAAIEGYAVAGGLELACWCDLRVASSEAVLGVFCRRFGVPLIDGGTVRLPRLIGESRALDLILTGRPVPADEALAMGLVNRVVEAGTAREAAEALALELTQFPQACLRADRRSVFSQRGQDEQSAMTSEFASGIVALPEARAGAARFAAGDGRGGSFD